MVLAGRPYVSAALAEKLVVALAEGSGDKLPHDLLSDREFEVMRFFVRARPSFHYALRNKLLD